MNTPTSRAPLLHRRTQERSLYDPPPCAGMDSRRRRTRVGRSVRDREEFLLLLLLLTFCSSRALFQIFKKPYATMRAAATRGVAGAGASEAASERRS